MLKGLIGNLTLLWLIWEVSVIWSPVTWDIKNSLELPGKEKETALQAGMIM